MSELLDKLKAEADARRTASWDRWYETLPSDLKRRLSLHDFRRLGECFRVAFNVEKVRPPENWMDVAVQAQAERSFCDVCGATDRPTATVIAYGIETNACDKCRGDE